MYNVERESNVAVMATMATKKKDTTTRSDKIHRCTTKKSVSRPIRCSNDFEGRSSSGDDLRKNISQRNFSDENCAQIKADCCVICTSYALRVSVLDKTEFEKRFAFPREKIAAERNVDSEEQTPVSPISHFTPLVILMLNQQCNVHVLYMSSF